MNRETYLMYVEWCAHRDGLCDDKVGETPRCRTLTNYSCVWFKKDTFLVHGQDYGDCRSKVRRKVLKGGRKVFVIKNKTIGSRMSQ